MVDFYSKLKYITVLMLLMVVGAGHALGQTTLYACDPDGYWADATIWYTDETCITSYGSIPDDNPVVIKSGANIQSNVGLTPPKQVKVESGATLSVTGVFNPSEAPVIEGVLNVTGGMTISGGNTKIIVADGGAINVDGLVSFPVEMTINGSFNVGTSFTGKKITTGSNSSIIIGQNYTVDAPSEFDGYVKIGGSYSGTEITTGNTSNVVISGDVTTNGSVNIDGEFIVSGDYTMNGGTFTVLDEGVVVVGGDLDRNGNVFNVDNNGYGAVYGDFIGPAGSGSTTIGTDGELVTIGTVTGCDDCTNNTIGTGDPVWDIDEGYRSLYWEDFLGDEGQTESTDEHSEWTIPAASPADVTAAPEELEVIVGKNNSVTVTLWESGIITTGCYSNITVSAYVGGSEYLNTLLQVLILNEDDEIASTYTLSEVDVTTGLRRNGTPISASKIKIRWTANAMEEGNATLDNISVSGEKGLGSEPADIVLVDNFNVQQVCADAQTAYRVTESYDTYSWSVTNANSITGANTSEAQVTWDGTLPADLSLTVSNSCGWEKTKTWPITDEAGFTISLKDLTNPSCVGEADGVIEVVANCGSSPTYEIYNNAAPETTWGASRVTGLPAGTYTAEATSGAETVSLNDIVLENPDSIKIRTAASETFSCDPDFGCSGLLEFTYSGGSGPLTPELHGDLAGGGTYVSSPVVEMVISSAYAVNDYPIIVNVNKDDYGITTDDFSDVRFFEDEILNIPLYYWKDTEASTTTDAVFYVKTDVAEGNSFYMIYGADHSYPSTSSLEEALTSGGMGVQYYENDTWSGTPSESCTDDNNKFKYNSSSTIGGDCDVQLSNSNPQSFIWSGWYPIPDLKYIKLDLDWGNNDEADSDLDDNGAKVMVFWGEEGSYDGGGHPGNTNLDVPAAYKGKTAYIEIWYSKTQPDMGEIAVAFSGSSGTIGGGDTYLNPGLGFSRTQINPEPSVTPVRSAKYTGLCEGIYWLTVTDGTCTATSENDTIEVDDTAVSWGDFPNDTTISLDDVNVLSPAPDQTLYYDNFADGFDAGYWSTTGSFSEVAKDMKFDGAGTGEATLNVSTNGFYNIGLDFEAYQSGDGDGNGWDSGDYIQIEYSTDNWSSSTTIITDEEVWSPDSPGIESFNYPNDGNGSGAVFSYSFDSDTDVNNNPDFQIRITVVSDEADENYYFRDITITGSIDNTIIPEDAGGYPVVLEGGFESSIVPTYYDEVTVDETCGGGIEITRTWNAVDECGNSAPSRMQIISLYDPDGHEPDFETFGKNPAGDYGHCYNTLTLDLPTAISTTCTPYTIGYTLDGVHHQVFSSDGEIPDPYTVDIDFPIGETTQFQWYVEDVISAKAYDGPYSVQVFDPITADDFEYDPLDKIICESESIEITVTPSGGSGVGLTYDFSYDDDGVINDDDDNVCVVSNLMDNQQVKVEISDNTECPPIEFLSDPIDVRPDITTNQVAP